MNSRIVAAVGIDTDSDLDSSLPIVIAPVIGCSRGEMNSGREEVDTAVLQCDLAAENGDGDIHRENTVFQLQKRRISVHAYARARIVFAAMRALDTHAGQRDACSCLQTYILSKRMRSLRAEQDSFSTQRGSQRTEPDGDIYNMQRSNITWDRLTLTEPLCTEAQDEKHVMNTARQHRFR